MDRFVTSALAFALAHIVTAAGAQAVYKCRAPDGGISFSDAECATGHKTLRSPPQGAKPPTSAQAPHATARRDLVMDVGGGDAIVFKGGEGQFWCNDPRYAGREIRKTWTVQGAGMSDLCELVPEDEKQETGRTQGKPQRKR